MAGDWLKMRCDLAEDPAVIAIAAKLELDEQDVVGRLHTLWSWADRQSRDGHAAGVTHAFLDRKVRRDGFAQAMVDVGWLQLDASGVTFPNFDRHNGKTAKERALGAVRQQKARSNVTPQVTSASRQESRIERDKSVTREEKRREEEKIKTSAGAPVDWIPSEVWQAFVEHRRTKRAKLTQRAIDLVVKKLEKYRASGVDPRTVLEFAIESGHTGLYYKPDQRHAGVNGHAAAAWAEVRAAIRAGQAPETWTHAPTPAAITELGGWAKLRMSESRDLDFRKTDFEKAFNRGAH